MSMELISIIVPVYNSATYLDKSISSLLNQTYKNIEIIIIDDGSTDDSPLVCDSYLFDSRVRVFHRENSGLSKTRQFGIDNCHGKYFATIDSDDYVAENYIEVLYENIKKQNADICVCSRYDFIDGSEKIIERKLNLTYSKIAITPSILSNKYCKYGSELICSDSWNKLYRTDFVKQSKVKFELNRKYNGNDLAFNYKLLLHCPVYAVIDEPLLYHRIVSGSMVHRSNKPLQEGFEIIVKQIISESKTINCYNRNQIATFYYKLLFLVFYDTIVYSSSWKELHFLCNQYIKKHISFSSEYSFLKSEKICIDDGMINRCVVFFTQHKRKTCLRIFADLWFIKKSLKIWRGENGLKK